MFHCSCCTVTSQVSFVRYFFVSMSNFRVSTLYLQEIGLHRLDSNHSTDYKYIREAETLGAVIDATRYHSCSSVAMAICMLNYTTEIDSLTHCQCYKANRVYKSIEK